MEYIYSRDGWMDENNYAVNGSLIIDLLILNALVYWRGNTIINVKSLRDLVI